MRFSLVAQSLISPINLTPLGISSIETFFQTFDRSDLDQSRYRDRGLDHNQAALHGAIVVCFDQAVETAL
jgi:hypothetical protein